MDMLMVAIWLFCASLVGVSVFTAVYFYKKSKEVPDPDTRPTTIDEKVEQDAAWDGAEYRTTSSWTRDKNKSCC